MLDCMRLDQWRVMAPLLAPFFEIDEGLRYSILPAATPYSRNAIFSGKFPEKIAAQRPGWWSGIEEDRSMNDFEDALLRDQLRRLMGRDVSVYYDKIFSESEAARVRARVNSVGKRPGVIALVFAFMEIARDEVPLRNLTRSWFERSPLAVSA